MEIIRSPSNFKDIKTIRSGQSTSAWGLKSNNRDYTLKWSILKRAGAYSSGAKRCNLCIEEKLYIMDAKNM
jgi:hypothetical protein